MNSVFEIKILHQYWLGDRESDLCSRLLQKYC
ncbi:hypothetical protein PaecuDRAFT_4004 [Paenibacillus curdlanolyticus YK9]|uniref:Uncharacterized protein n=1 Tax=Paenibacillus curdlanolyticus YK9 TaxID=717606 RepID=E0IEB3_9BACL|nr:hypothetical protein PaecuDRAFT_4004 [Paenibacillus curdlanolyticus YK9]